MSAENAALFTLLRGYIETGYSALREHADDLAYQLADPKAAALYRSQVEAQRTTSTFSPAAQIHTQRIQDAVVAAETKALANRKAGLRKDAAEGAPPQRTPPTNPRRSPPQEGGSRGA